MRKYELTLIMDSKASSSKKKAVGELVEKVVALSKGKVGRVADWGEKDLAYKIGKAESGVYLHYPLELEAGSVKDLTSKIKANEDVIRYLLVEAK